MHWGVYSVPSFGQGGGAAAEWFWWYLREKSKPYVDFMAKNYPPGFKYADFAPMFHAEFFDPNQWADLLAKSGAEYYVLTSKHHDGFTNWPSKESWNWNSVNTGPHRDLVGDLAKAIRQKSNVTFCLYFSLFEFFHPYYLEDADNGFHTQKYVNEIMLPQLYDIINNYKPEYLWTDGDWLASSEYFRSTDFLAWLYNESPVKDTVVVNDRWGNDTRCKHGGVYTCSDRFNPGVLQSHKFEDATTADKLSWGYRRNMNIGDLHTAKAILEEMIIAISCGGNFLLNVGPTHDGRIDAVFQERLLQIGEWLAVNGEAIYKSKPWRVQNDTTNPNVWYTSKPKELAVYAITFQWPTDSVLKLDSPVTTRDTTVSLVGYEGEMSWHTAGKPHGIIIEIPPIPESLMP
ncbi:hypothetical protein QZH41_015136 [Actinostola sp. cb2023]|nr:hypothetical protein QZH41_015136 [Actinostola sp. cb2023]